MSMDYPALELLLAGRWAGAQGRKTMPVHNPSTAAVLGELPCASDADIDEALAAAARGFAVWSRMSPTDRGKILRRTSDLMRERREYLATLVTLELGKPIAEARTEVEQAAGIFEWNAEE